MALLALGVSSIDADLQHQKFNLLGNINKTMAIITAGTASPILLLKKSIYFLCVDRFIKLCYLENKGPHPVTNLGSLHIQKLTRIVKIMSTATSWKVIGPSSSYFFCTSSFICLSLVASSAFLLLKEKHELDFFTIDYSISNPTSSSQVMRSVTWPTG